MEWKGIPAEHPGSHFGAKGGGQKSIGVKACFFTCMTDVFKDY